MACKYYIFTLLLCNFIFKRKIYIFMPMIIYAKHSADCTFQICIQRNKIRNISHYFSTNINISMKYFF